MNDLNEFKIFGTKISCSSGFLLLLAWVHFIDREGVILSALLACFLHELGHYLGILACGGQVERLHFTVVGGNMTLPTDLSYGKECFCTLAGPAVNLMFGILCFSREGWEVFGGFHYALGILNLFPVKKLDGGRALDCLLSGCCPLEWYPLKDAVVEGLHWVFSSMLLGVGVYLFLEGGSITLFLLGLWLIWTDGRQVVA